MDREPALFEAHTCPARQTRLHGSPEIVRRILRSAPAGVPRPSAECEARVEIRLGLNGENFGWETWTRTRIARSRVWSPTNWTISQPLGGMQPLGAFPQLHFNLTRVKRRRAFRQLVRAFPHQSIFSCIFVKHRLIHIGMLLRTGCRDTASGTLRLSGGRDILPNPACCAEPTHPRPKRA